MMNCDTPHSSQLMLPHAGMSSRCDRTEALALRVSSKVRLLAVLKRRKPQQTQPRPQTQQLLHAINQHHFRRRT
jgi:hypothetical protein